MTALVRAVAIKVAYRATVMTTIGGVGKDASTPIESLRPLPLAVVGKLIEGGEAGVEIFPMTKKEASVLPIRTIVPRKCANRATLIC